MENSKIDRKVSFFFICNLIVIFIFRLRHLFWMGGRNIGTYAYVGDMILHGKIPYRDIWENKSPLIFYLNALLFKFFGSHFETIAFFEILWIFITCFFVYKLSNLVFERGVSLFISFVYAIYTSAVEFTEGFGALETYVFLPTIIAVFSVVKYKITLKKFFLFISGLMTSVAFLFRQNGAIIALPIMLYLTINHFYERHKLSRLFLKYAIFSFGVFIPIIGFTIYFFLNGALNDVISQIFVYNFYYASPELFSIVKLIKQAAFSYLTKWPFLIIFGTIGILYGFFDFLKEIKDKTITTNMLRYNLFVMLMSWFLLNCWFIYFMGKDFEGYYLQLVPSLALLSGYSIEFLFRQLKQPFKLTSFMLVFVLVLTPLPIEIWRSSRFLIDKNLFLNESNSIYLKGIRYAGCRKPLLIEWIVQNTTEEDFIYFWGHEVGFNFFIKRKSPSKYTNLYPLLMPGYVKSSDIERFIDDLRKNKPKFIIDMNIGSFSSSFTGAPSLNLKNIKDKYPLLPVVKFINKSYSYEITIEDWDIYRLK